MAENGPLPTTDPATATNAHDENSRTYCFRIIGQHYMCETGESRWAPWKALLTTRLLSGFIFIAFLIVTILKFPGVWSVATFATFGFSTVTFLALAICTYLQGTGAWLSQNWGLSSTVVLLHFITAALSVYLVVYFILLIFLGGFRPELLVLLLPLAVYLLDVLVMRSRIRFQYRYALLFTTVTVVYDVIYFVVDFLSICPDCAGGSASGVAVVIDIAIASLAALLAVWITRCPCPCLDKPS